MDRVIFPQMGPKDPQKTISGSLGSFYRNHVIIFELEPIHVIVLS